MPKKYVHIVKDEINDRRAQVHDGVTYQPFTRIFYCGKNERLISETPLIIPPEDQKRLDKEREKLEANWPETCPKCRKAKDEEARRSDKEVGK